MKIVEPEVKALARTTIMPSAIEHHMEIQKESTDAETLTVFAGRSCYESWIRPNEKTRKDKDYLERTLFEQGHWSIAEHASVTFYITGVSRAFTHELIRHRHLSYSQLSQRFVDSSDFNVVAPPAFYDFDSAALDRTEYVAEMAAAKYKAQVESLTKQGLGRKQAREAARAFLPNMAETRIVVTGNLRAWHEFCQRRMQPDADAEIQKVAGMIYDELHHVAPAIFPKEKSSDAGEAITWEEYTQRIYEALLNEVDAIKEETGKSQGRIG